MGNTEQQERLTLFDNLQPDILKKYGFGKRFVGNSQIKDGYPLTILTKEGIWVKRIHVLIWLFYDTSSGSMTLIDTNTMILHYGEK